MRERSQESEMPPFVPSRGALSHVKSCWFWIHTMEAKWVRKTALQFRTWKETYQPFPFNVLVFRRIFLSGISTIRLQSLPSLTGEKFEPASWKDSCYDNLILPQWGKKVSTSFCKLKNFLQGYFPGPATALPAHNIGKLLQHLQLQGNILSVVNLKPDTKICYYICTEINSSVFREQAMKKGRRSAPQKIMIITEIRVSLKQIASKL